MPLSLKLEHVIEEVISEHPVDQKRALKKLARVKLTESEARTVWPRVLEHKWYMSERLGRDVGLKVAAVDYLENIRPPHVSSSFRTVRDTIPGPLRFMRPLSSQLSR
jgi:hypothetical protein